jgi:hypothetical protein
MTIRIGSPAATEIIRVQDEAIRLEDAAERHDLSWDVTTADSVANRENNKLVLDAAIADAEAAAGGRGGIVQLPIARRLSLAPGVFIPPTVAVRGMPEDRTRTELYFRSGGASTSLDKTIYGGDTAIWIAPGQFPCRRALSGVKILGEASQNIPATVDPPEEYGTGIRAWSASDIGDLEVNGFCYGLDVRIQHTNIFRVALGGCWAGLYTGPRDPIQGDGRLDEITITGQGEGTWCSVAIHPTHYIGGLLWTNSHLGFSRYGIWIMANSRWGDDVTDGTISCSTNSALITGVGTNWKSTVKQGSYFFTTGIPSNRPRMVRRVISDTEIELVSVAGVNRSGGTYAIYDGPASKAAAGGVPPSIAMGGVTLIDVAFEAVRLAHIAQEDMTNVRSVSGCRFINCDTANSGTGGLARAAFETSIRWCEFIGSTGMLNGEYYDAIILGAAGGLHGPTNWGDLEATVATCNARGIPFYREHEDVSGTSVAGHGRVGDHRVRIVRANTSGGATPIVPGDLLGSSVTDLSRVHASPIAAAGRRVIGVALTAAKADVSEGVIMQTDGMAAVNVAQAVVVSEAASSGDTTLTLISTARLGGNGTSVTLVNSSGTTIATGTVASGTTVTVDPLGAAVAKGTRLWVQRTATAQVTATHKYLKARYGSTGGGSSAVDVGQALEATGPFDTENEPFGVALGSDNGRTVNALIRGM